MAFSAISFACFISSAFFFLNSRSTCAVGGVRLEVQLQGGGRVERRACRAAYLIELLGVLFGVLLVGNLASYRASTGRCVQWAPCRVRAARPLQKMLAAYLRAPSSTLDDLLPLR